MTSIADRLDDPRWALDDLASMAAAQPGGVAIEVEGGDDLTYGSWERRSNAIARGLAARDVGRGDRVALLFDARHWADFAAGYLGVVKSGATAALFTVGAPGATIGHAISAMRASGVLCPPHLAPRPSSGWVATPDDVAGPHGTGPLARPRPAGLDAAAPAELIYPSAALVPSRPVRRAPAAFAVEGGALPPGWLVHTWPPGSQAGQDLLAWLLRSPGRSAASLARFGAEALCALVAGRRATGCGLTPGLAAAVVSSGAAARFDLTSVTEVLVGPRPARPDLLRAVGAAFPNAIVRPLDAVTGPRDAPQGGTGVAVAVSQEGMLWHEQFAPASFNLPCLVRRYQGHLDVGALGRALSEIVRLNEPLRGTFQLAGGEPRQVVHRHRPLDLAVVDLTPLSSSQRDAEVARLLAQATGCPFDLVDGPLFSPRLLRLASDDHVLVVRLHHSVFDDWSVDVFRRQLSSLYGAFVAGEGSPLAEPSGHFSDYCRRQRDRLDGGAGTAERAYWRAQMAGAPLSVQLPIGDPDRGGAAEAAGPLRRDLSAELARGLRALGPRLRATPFMTVLAAFNVLLTRYTGQDDLVIASVVAHRDRTELEALIGCFAKKVLLRLNTLGDPTFPELVAQVRGTVLGALEHQDLAFETVVQETLGPVAAAHGVVPQVAVVFQGETPQQFKLALPGLQTSRFDAPVTARRERHFSSARQEEPGGAAAPPWGDGIYLGTFLILSLLETGDGLALVAKGVFHPPAVELLLDRFETLLAELVRDPGQRVLALSSVAGATKAQEPPPGDGDVLELGGFRVRRSRTERALARCPGVAEVAVALGEDADGNQVLVAYVVAAAGRRPTLGDLRTVLWAQLPGSLWPAQAVVIDSMPRRPDGTIDRAALALGAGPGPTEAPGPDATLLAELWTEARHGEAVSPNRSYWQDFSFLQALAEARQAGLAITDDQVTRCRTPEMLEVALAAAPARPR